MSTVEDVKKYYGETLKSSEDLKTSACCPADAVPDYLKPIVSQIHPEVQERFYGCGSPVPAALDGCTVLDLGCGTGRDSFIISKLVGAGGQVIGVDMTGEQLAVAREHVDYHRRQFGFPRSNVAFHEGYIEDLSALGIDDDSVDVVVSNCVLNLSGDKSKVFAEIFRVLKPGGELYFSDVFADKRIPAELQQDPVIRGECLGGALYTEDFRRLLLDLGINDYRTISQTKLTVEDKTIARRLGNINFYSITIRAFNIPLEDRCEDYGQTARFLGGIPESPDRFLLDDHHEFAANEAIPVCGNTARMLARSRFAPWFKIEGDESTHFGLFDCVSPVTEEAGAAGGCC